MYFLHTTIPQITTGNVTLNNTLEVKMLYNYLVVEP